LPQKQPHSVKNIQSSGKLNLTDHKKGPGYHSKFSKVVNSLNKINKNPMMKKDLSKKIQKKISAD